MDWGGESSKWVWAAPNATCPTAGRGTRARTERLTRRKPLPGCVGQRGQNSRSFNHEEHHSIARRRRRGISARGRDWRPRQRREAFRPTTSPASRWVTRVPGGGLECEDGTAPSQSGREPGPGSPYQEDSISGAHYAGEQDGINNKNTASVSQYDIACFKGPAS